MSIRQSREQTIERELRRLFPKVRASTIRNMRRALLICESRYPFSDKRWIPTRFFTRRNITKWALELLVEKGFLEVRTRRGKMLFSVRQQKIAFPSNRDQLIDAEVDILLQHAQANNSARNIITSELGLETTATIPEIKAQFNRLNTFGRVNVYNTILREIENRSLRSGRYDYQAIEYRNFSDLFSLSIGGKSWLEQF